MGIAEHAPSSRDVRPSPHHGAAEERRRYVRQPEPIHFPVSEEVPETNRHLELRTLLYLILKRELASRGTIGSDQFVYYDPTTAKKNLAPDAFVKLGEPHKTFRIWKTWQRGAPDVAVEVVSDFDQGDEVWEAKLERYRACGVGEVVRFDPDDEEQPIRVWDHVDGDLVERAPPEEGLFECVPLGLYWVALHHSALDQVLRLARDPAGKDLLPTPEEAEARARQEEARARREAEDARNALATEVEELRRQLAEAQAAASSAKQAPASPAPRAKKKHVPKPRAR